MARGVFKNLSFRAGVTGNNDESDAGGSVVDNFAQVHRPKLKFNFTVSFKFRAPIIIGGKDDNAQMADELTFALKQSSRPNPTVIYQDINYYNMRTKVATKVDYGSLQMMFYDDVENFAHDVYEVYLKTISPIANIRKERVNTAITTTEATGAANAAFNTEGVIEGSSDKIDGGTGSIGPLPPEAEFGLLENITIRHWFFSETERRDPNEDSAGTEASTDAVDNIQYVEYQFLNPKIVNMTLDELDMTQSDASTVMMNFVYDSVYINAPRALAPALVGRETDGKTFTINDIRARALDIQRLIRRVRRLDTLPDISILEAANFIVPPISGNLPNIPGIKPDVELPPILGTI